jgi:hypothetical protein
MKTTFRDVEVKVIKHEGASEPVVVLSSIPQSGVTKAYDELTLKEWGDLVDAVDESVAALEAEPEAEPPVIAEGEDSSIDAAPKKKAKGKSK